MQKISKLNLKIFAIILFILIPIVFLCCGCDMATKTILSIEKTETNGLVDTYTIRYSDGSRYTFEITNGKDGKDGKDGQDGINGTNGKDGKDGQDGINGTNGTDGATGPQGPQGLPGINGTNGTNGQDGMDGANGTNGKDGQDLKIEDIYQAAVNNGYQGTFMEFLEVYLKVNTDKSEVINKNLLSSVAVQCEFENPTTQNNGYAYAETENAKPFAVSLGAGVIYRIDKSQGNAYIITNYHVVFNPEGSLQNKISKKISVFLYGSTYSELAIPARYIGGAMAYDIAILKVENNEFLKQSDAKAVEICQNTDIVVGQTAIAIGNPHAGGISATQGIVSVDSEYIDLSLDKIKTEHYRVMRIDTDTNRGNSGGGVYNTNGELIGIVNAGIEKVGYTGFGFALPVQNVVNVANNIIAYENDNKDGVFRFNSKVGFGLNDSRAVYDSINKVTKIAEKVAVREVKTDSAFFGKLQANDIITSININGQEVKIDRMFKIVETFLNVRVGDTVTINYLRGNQADSAVYVAKSSDLVQIL